MIFYFLFGVWGSVWKVFFGVGSVWLFELFEGFEIVGMVQELREWESVEGVRGFVCVVCGCVIKQRPTKQGMSQTDISKF